jgi:hypothetical protein
VRQAFGITALALGIALAAPTGAQDAADAPVTFAREVRAILAARCVTCHSASGSAPMPLGTYEDVRPWARAIREQVLTRRMPKWHAARGFGAFANDQSLSPFEQSILVSWIDSGMPEGTPARAAAATLPRLRRTATSATVRLVVPARADVGRLHASGPRWVTGWSFAPGDPLITAAVISLDGVPAATWVAGDGPVALPAGTGFRSAGRIRVDVRRRAAARYEQPFVPRRSVVTLITETERPARRAWTEQVACGALRSGPPADLLAVRPLLDRAEARLWVARAGAPGAIVGWFRDFDPLYPRTYWLQRPIEFNADARLSSEAPCRVELTLAAPATPRR